MLDKTLRLLAAPPALVALVACGTGEDATPDDSTSVTSDVATLPGAARDDVEVSGPLGSGATWNPDTGSIQFDADSSVVGKVAVMDTSRDFGWTATYPYWFADLETQSLSSQATSSHEVGPLSTAVDLLLLTPNTGTRDGEILPDIIDVLRSVPEVQALADFLEDNAETADPMALPGFPVAFEAAIIAGVDAIDAAELTPSQLQPESAFPVDQVFTTARESRGDVTVEWKRDVWPLNRTLTHHGVFYEVDTSAYEDESRLRMELANDGYGVAPSLVSDSPVARITLPAEDPAAVIDIIGLAMDVVYDAIFSQRGPFQGLPVANEETLPEGAYMLQMQACATMQYPLAMSRAGMENYAQDLEAIFGWPRTTAHGNAANACVQLGFESAVDLVSLVVDIGDVVKNRVNMVLDDPWPGIWAATATTAYSTVTSTGDEAWENSDIRHLTDTFMKALLTSAGEAAADAAVKGTVKMYARSLASLVDLPGKLSTAASLTARSVTAAGMTPLESTLIVVGRPCDGTPPPTGLLAVKGGENHSLALDQAGIAWAWGDDEAGQLGDGGTNTNRPTPVQVVMPTGVAFTSISAGFLHSLALDEDGNVWAWGLDSYGQLGDGGTNTDQSMPVPVEMPPGVSFTAIDAGITHSVALDESGNAWSWGGDFHGSLGDGGTDTEQPTRVPVSMPSGTNFTSIAAGAEFAIALDTDGNAWSWGRDDYGQLGDGGMDSHQSTPVPVVMPEGVSFTSVAAASFSPLALDTVGNAWSWGSNSTCQVGIGSLGGTYADQPVPVEVEMPSGVTVTSISAGGYHSLAADTDGNAWSWGEDSWGELGDGGSDWNQCTPVLVVRPTGISFSDVAAGGGAFPCAGHRWESLELGT